ncbi:hypothetical protein NKDENANG_01747 [Candidatus Entotheonellaceae bacterium PAL068K]
MNEHTIHHITAYLDDELQGEERRLFEGHVDVCAECREALEYERALVREIRQSYSVSRAPESLRAQVEQMLQHSRLAWRRRVRLGVTLATAAATVLGLVFLWNFPSAPRTVQAPSSRFAFVAVDVHQRYTRMQLPLEVTSDSPTRISAWFAGKVPFNLKLPNYPETPGQEKPYEIVGARLLLGFEQVYAAYVAYRLHHRPISLLVTSETTAQPSGGEVIPWQGLRFHFDAIDGWKVLTWSDNGLTYALVSDFEERGQASCIVCHPGAQNQRLFQDLQP